MTGPKSEILSPGPVGNERAVYCNRTLNMRSIRAVGYDMDYTLVHYHVEAWEKRAYEYLKQHFVTAGWPVKDLQFDSMMITRGLVIDSERGNLLKANRFGFVKRAMHGTKIMDFESQRQTYSRMVVDLADRNFIFLNTLFSLSEGCMYAQLVDLLDRGQVPEVLGYRDLYERVRSVLDTAHMEGRLKADILADPERFVLLDDEVPLTLLDQHHAGKKLMLITNSEWNYTAPIMSFAFDKFLPGGMKWKDLFEVVIVGARKPQFFSTESPLFEIVTDEGLLKPSTGALKRSTAYLGGSARSIERHLGLSGDEILYVGDHMFGDVHVTKNVLRWRTALIVRELEEEIRAVEKFRDQEAKLAHLMDQKQHLEAQHCDLRLELQRRKLNYAKNHLQVSETELQKGYEQITTDIGLLDQDIAPLARAAGELSNPIWGLLMRAGNDKSHLAYQLERYADIYTSRISNFLYATPFVYLRSPRGSLPHDLSLPGGRPVAATK